MNNVLFQVTAELLQLVDHLAALIEPQNLLLELLVRETLLDMQWHHMLAKVKLFRFKTVQPVLFLEGFVVLIEAPVAVNQTSH